MAPHSPSPPTPPPKDIPRRSRLGTLERLPNEILCDIISYVPPDDISELRASCKFLNELVKVNEPQIARGIIDLRYPFLKAKIMPYGPVDPVDQLGDEVLVRASPMNPMWFFDMVVAQRMHICHCRECLSKMDTIFLCLDWWEETRKLRARIAPRVTNASAKTSKKLRDKLHNLVGRSVTRLLPPIYNNTYRMEGDGFYLPKPFDRRLLKRFPQEPMEWVHFLKRLNLQLLIKLHTRALFSLHPIRVRITAEEQATDRVIRLAYDAERAFLQEAEWDGQQSLLDFLFDRVTAIVPPPHRHNRKFDREMRNIFESIRLSMFFEYIEHGLTHHQIYSGPIPEYTRPRNLGRLLIF